MVVTDGYMNRSDNRPCRGHTKPERTRQQAEPSDEIKRADEYIIKLCNAHLFFLRAAEYIIPL